MATVKEDAKGKMITTALVDIAYDEMETVKMEARSKMVTTTLVFERCYHQMD